MSQNANLMKEGEHLNVLGLAFGIAAVLGSILIVLALNASSWVVLYGVLLSIPFFLNGFGVLQKRHVFFLVGAVMILYAIYDNTINQLTVMSLLVIVLSGVIAIALGVRQ